MAMSSPGTPRPTPKKRGRSKGLLLFWLCLFGLGFYSGNLSTRKVIRDGHPLLQRMMGVADLLTQAAPTPQNTLAPSSQPTPNNPQIKPTTPNAAPGVPLETSTKPPTQQRSTESSQEAVPDLTTNPDELDKMVRDYNLVLRQVMEEHAQFQTARKITSNANANPQDQEKAILDQSNAAEKLVTAVQRAQTLYDHIHGQSQFDKRYKETYRAIAASDLPKSLPEMSVDNLKFIRPR